MQWSDSNSPAQTAIVRALSGIERRLRLNRRLYQATLLAGLILLVPLTAGGLRWLGNVLPVASAVLVLLAAVGAVALLGLLLASALRQRSSPARAAAEADARACLKDELTSAYWFMQALPGSEWVGAQLERAARTARGLDPARLVPVRVSAAALGALAAAVVVLAALWAATPLAPAEIPAAATVALSAAEQEQVRALRALVDALPDSEAARKLEQALQTLERGEASAEERSRALAQAQDVVQQIGLDAASTRDALHRAAELLRDQAGMEAVAEALARGDAQKAAELLGRMQEAAAQPKGDKPPVPEPAGGAADKSLEQALLQASEVAGPQAPAASPEAVQQAVDRLNEIARELAAAKYVNEAWEKVRGPQLDIAQRTALTASRFAEQTTGNSLPSPASGETPMGGGSMFRSAVVAEGKGRTEQEGGTRAGDALGDAPPDPLLGAGGERLEAQLEQAGLSGPEAENQDVDTPWFYAQSREQKAFTGWRNVQARARFAQAQAGTNEGISIQHRQIVKDYFMNLRESTQ